MTAPRYERFTERTGSVRNSKLLFRDAFRWEAGVESFVANKIKEGMKVLNAPCGESKLGNYRLDIDQARSPTHLGDINALPFENCTFDLVIQDISWGVGYYKRMKPFFEAVRVCKVGGEIIYNATWIPESKAVSLETTKIRQSAPFANVSILSVFTKINKQFDDSAYRSK